MAFAADFALAVENVLVMAELCVLALLTSQFASDARRLNAIVLVVCFVALYSAALAVAATALFYAGIETSLLGDYGALGASDRYARIAAGFESATLLGSFCIFASAIAARDDSTLPIGLRRMTQVALAVVVVMTLSRAVLGFAAAIAIRAAYRPSQPRVVRIAAVTGVVVSVLLIVALTVGRPHVDLSDPGASSYEFATEQVDRWNFAGDGIEAFADRPLVGHGPGALTASYLYEDYRAHITPLNVAATMGIAALAALVFLIVTLQRNRRRPTTNATRSA